MLKPLALIAALGLTAAVTASASDADANFDKMRKNVGVGLGTLLWSNAGSGLIPQICAATTNGTFGNQTFAITSGTSKAEKYGDMVKAKDLRDYVAGNMDGIARDAAAGRGESVDVLAELASIPSDKRAAFAARLQSEVPAIFTGTVTDAVVTERVLAIASAI